MFVKVLALGLATVCSLSVAGMQANAMQETAKSTKGTMKVAVKSLRSDKGQVYVAVFDKADAFPRAPEKAMQGTKLKPKDGIVSVEFPNLPPGDYAISVFHDEDEDGKMKFGMMGIPREGFGFSRNKKVYFGPPKFEDASVTFPGSDTTFDVQMKYF